MIGQKKYCTKCKKTMVDFTENDKDVYIHRDLRSLPSEMQARWKTSGQNVIALTKEEAAWVRKKANGLI